MTVIAIRKGAQQQNNGRIFIALPGYKNRSVLDFAVELGGVLRQTPLYNFNNCVSVLYQNEQDIFFKTLSPAAFITYVDRYVTPYAVTRQGNPCGKSIELNLAKILMEVPEFLGSLLEVKRVNKVRLPLFTKAGMILSPAGYHQESKTITLDRVAYHTDMGAEEAKNIINDVFSEFPFYGSSSKRFLANAISGMLGLYCVNILPSGIVRPSFYVGANDSGAGKTTLAKLIAFPVHGTVSTKCQEHETELKKYLVGCVEEGRQVIIFDNMKGLIDSGALQQFLTTVKFEGRRLGSNQIYRGNVEATVIITGNGCRMSADSYRRTLPVMLAMHESIFHNRKFKRSLENLDATGLRPKLLSALWALVQNWDKSGRPSSKNYNSSFGEWSKMVGGILEAADFGDSIRLDLKTIEIDDDLADIELMIEAMKVDGSLLFEFTELLILCCTSGAYDSIINDQNFARFSLYGRNRMRQIFEKYLNRKIAGVYFLSHGRGTNRRYFMSERLPKDVKEVEEIRLELMNKSGIVATKAFKDRQAWAKSLARKAEALANPSAPESPSEP